jgi:sensor histidine kinase YesM
MASIHGASGIADISTALSRLLKNISKGTEHLIPLKDEIALVNDYFTIMKYRYGGTISLDYRIDDESLLSSRVNRFSLQPIVENAIFHGIEPKGNAGMITIHVYRGDDNTLKIAVTDNGVGMDDEMIRKVLSGESKEANDFFRHVGVSNVNKRIRFSFGEQYGITITSRIGEFTTMLFTLPVRAAEDSQTQEEH